MRVLLVNPPALFEVAANNPKLIDKSRGHNPPLGLLLLAGYLEKHSDHTARVLDAQAAELTYDDLAETVADFRPDVVGITAMTLTLIDVLRTISVVRATVPSARIVLGGPHVHLFPEETIRLPGVDFVVLGEGEITFERLLRAIDTGADVEQIRGLVFLRDGEVVQTGPPVPIEDLDSLPFPARHLTDINRYSSVLFSRQPVTTMFTSRGCPFQCAFCDRPHLGKRFRSRSAGNIVDEMQACISSGIRDFLIYDDTFTIQRDRVVAFCLEILKRRLDVTYDIRARVDTVDPELLKLLAKSGCQAAHYGVEAGTEKTLKVLRKGINLNQARAAFAQTRAAGIQVLAYFMIGCPGETRDDVLDSFRLARELDPDYLHLTIFTPFPGTSIYTQGLNSGVLEHDVWRHFARAPGPGFVPPHWPEVFTLAELQDLLEQGYRSFYRRPSYVLKRTMAIRSFGDFYRKARAGMRVLRMGR